MRVESYIGMPLYSAQGNVLGILVAMHTAALESEAEITALFEIIGYRIAAELERVEQDRSLNMLSSIFKNSLIGGGEWNHSSNLRHSIQEGRRLGVRIPPAIFFSFYG